MNIFSKVLDVVKTIISPVENIIDELHVSDEEKGKIKLQLQEAENSLTERMAGLVSEEIESQKEILVREITQGSKLTRSWRPALMIVCMALLFNRFLVVPYLHSFGAVADISTFDFPGEIKVWIGVALTGYTGLRSAEKIFGIFKGKK